MSNASSALSDVSSGHLGRRQAEPRQRYGAVTAAGANEMGPLPPLPPLPFTSPISPPSALPPLPPLPPLNTSGSPMKTQARRHSAPIVSSPSKRSYVSPFPPPTSPLPPIPSEDGLMYPGWPASLSAISQGLDPMRGVMRNGAARKTPPVWPPSRRPAHEDEEEEEEWRHPYAIASSPTRDYQWDRPQSDLDDARARRRSTDRGSEAYNGMSPLDLPPIDSLPPFGMIGTSKRSLGSGQRRLAPHESCARCRTLKPLSKLRAILLNGPLYCSDCREARKLVAQASPASLATFEASLGVIRTPYSSRLPLLGSNSGLFRRENADLDLLTSPNRRFSSQEDLDLYRRPQGVTGLYRAVSSRVTGGRGDAYKGRVSPIPASLPETMTGSAPSNLYATSPGFLDVLRKGRRESRGGAIAGQSDGVPSPPATTSDPWRFMQPPSPSPSLTSRTSPTLASVPGRFSLPPLFAFRSRRGSDTTDAGGVHPQRLPVPEAMGTRPSSWNASDPIPSWDQAEGQSRRSSCIEEEGGTPIDKHGEGVALDSTGQGTPVSSTPKSRRRSFRRSLIIAFQ